ncbi:MAG: hypothetical protein M3454_06945 [Actinomycetota bacterium]|nr:hypothetical protein [Actinomycetota bacterium]
MKRSPAGRLLVLSANLKKSVARDRVDTEIMNFAGRVSRVVPFAPDAVLLQEVVESSTARVAQLLEESTGSGFEVAVSPGPEPIVGAQDDQIVVRNTAILLNRKTMQVAGEGGLVPSRYASRDAAPEEEPRVKEHAHCLARTKAGDIEVPLVSVHFVTNQKFAASTMGFCYKAKWARELTTFVQTQYPRGDALQMPVIGGDFNNRRCLRSREKVACEVLPFWHVLTDQGGFSDAVFERHGGSDKSLSAQMNGRKRIDYVFVRGEVLDASHDAGYAARRGDRDFYSDHRLLWALVKPSGAIPDDA